jgi:transposase
MLQMMKSKYGKANRIWVMDRGMISEENLEYMRRKGARYLVGTPKFMLNKFEQQLLEDDWEEVQSGVDVKLLPSSDGEVFVLCRSQKRRDKDNAILNRFVQNMEAGLTKMAVSMETGKLKSLQKAERRIGRLQERNSRAASLFTITIEQTEEQRLKMTVRKDEERYRKLLETGGNYLLRTNWSEADPKTIWRTYIQLTEVEDAFRTAKHDLGIRPIYHQKQDRTQAHILVCFLALTMWRTLQQWMKASGLGTAPRKLLEELRELKSLDVLLPTRDKQIRLRVVSNAPKELKVLLHRMKILLPSRPKIIENVVQKIS